jgi:hypothetical protein
MKKTKIKRSAFRFLSPLLYKTVRASLYVADEVFMDTAFKVTVFYLIKDSKVLQLICTSSHVSVYSVDESMCKKYECKLTSEKGLIRQLVKTLKQVDKINIGHFIYTTSYVNDFALLQVIK